MGTGAADVPLRGAGDAAVGRAPSRPHDGSPHHRHLVPPTVRSPPSFSLFLSLFLPPSLPPTHPSSLSPPSLLLPLSVRMRCSSSRARSGGG
eukprot:193043-Rhodomonas_salina.1